MIQKSGIPPLVPSGGRPPIPPSQSMRQPQPPMTRTPLLGPNFGNGSSVARAAPTVAKYVELSRLPTEMLRPAVLEQFLSQGIHMNTLVRFDNPADADAVLARDGELAPAENADHKRDSEHSRRRSRSRSRDRSRTRSRDRRSARHSRSRSAPKRSRQTTGSTRWCLQLTNVPFRCTEQELIEWMSERVRPTKVTRTFYADGNASDRWIAEFESESLMERAMGIKRLLIGRTVKMCHIENEQADELLKIEDVYGERRKESSEKAANAEHRDIKPVIFKVICMVQSHTLTVTLFQPAAATDDLVASLGPKGTVVSCCGFPSDVTMEDVLGFFKGYPVDHNSVRIRMGDDGIPTGECMLAMSSPESSKKAVSVLAGRKLRGQVVSLQLANP
ncbi:unnamed protein product [Haemonchus placei]|uniref:RRM domain-containing protein n=1 Tax=Haemonchus placei TaxID=6290 RepID=A0A3P7YBI4_HAEPC|nr:unnamed protein product [Haemonchus placei]